MSNVPKLRFKEFREEWNKKPLSHYLYEHKERNYNAKYNKDKVLSVSGDCGIVNQIEHLGRSYAGDSVLNYHIVQHKDIVYTKSPLKANPYGIIKTNKGESGIVSTLYAVYRCKDNINNIFLDYYFSLDSHLNKYLRPLVQKGAKNDMKINNQKVLIDPISIPIKQEQEKIASFLTSVDTKIEQLTKKEALLTSYKKGVMQKIFNQEIRFKADDGSEFCDWKKERLSKYLVEYKEKSKIENEYPVLTSSNKGLMLQSDYFGENRLTERDNMGFNIVPDKFITYRSRSDNRTFTFNINTLGFIGIISTYYPVFECKDGDNRFIVTLLNENKHLIGKYSVGTSQTVLSFNELKNIKFLLPTAEEQTKIANFLSSIDSKIEQIQKQLNSTKEFKKALLQQMFV